MSEKRRMPRNFNAGRSIMEAAIRRVDPVRMITDCVSLQGEELRIATEDDSYSLSLKDFRRIVVLGAGKAGASMAYGLETVLSDRIDDGLVSVKYGHTGASGQRLSRVRLIEAGHPVPDENSLKAGGEIASMAMAADRDTLILVVISGGGSALLTLPAEHGNAAVDLEDIRQTTELLLGAGTPIGEINCVRKHLSGISGGRFCSMAAPATVIPLILSDVVGDELDSIASGLAAPDPTTFDDALAICRTYGIVDRLPEAVAAMLEAGASGRIPDTPKPGDPIFRTVRPVLIGTNAQAVEAADRLATDLGYNTLVLTSRLVGEAREIAHLFTAMAADVVSRNVPVARPACILAGGETTVTLRGTGTGGRNQEMALAVLADMASRPASYDGVTFLSFGTDGNDGPTDAAGGWATPELATQTTPGAITAALADNDAYHLLDSIGALVKTGPTNTNVCDIQVLLVE
jgi:glycerate 2-kinase